MGQYFLAKCVTFTKSSTIFQPKEKIKMYYHVHKLTKYGYLMLIVNH